MPAKRSRPGSLLLCLDVQPVFIAAMSNPERFVQRCSFTLAAATGLDIPVAFTEQVPQKLGSTADKLRALAPRAPAWGKTTFSALADDGIRDAIRVLDVDHLLICGLETPVCVYQTAIEAIDAQYQVTVLVDAVDARRPDDAAAALAELSRAGVRLLPSETVFYAMLRGAKHPFFRDFTGLVKRFAG